MAKTRVSLAERYPHLALQWHPTKNGLLRPEDVTSGSSKRVWWLCPECGHTWQAIINNRTGRGSGCPVCSGRVRATGADTMTKLYPQLALDYLPELNDDVPFDDLHWGSKVRVTWRCHVCGHEWNTHMSSRALSGSSCPECRQKEMLKENGTLAQVYPEVACEWHPEKNDSLTPNDVAPKSSKRVWWRCGRCGYEWEAVIAKRTASGTGCPECARLRYQRPKPLIERGYPMRVAVTMDVSDGSVFSGLGRSDAIYIYGIKDGSVDTCEKYDVKGLRRQGIMKLLKEQHATHFVTGELGGNALDSLRPMGIIVYYDVSGDAVAAVQKVIAGETFGRCLGDDRLGVE